jgi:hypothetical protein
MENFIFAFFVGFVVGGALCAIGAQRGWRKVRRETTTQLKESCKIRDGLYSAITMADRSALERLEAGDIEGAKRGLSDSIATFYQIQSAGRRDLALIGIQPDEPDWIARELRAIELDAKRFESLRAALARKPPATLEELVNGKQSAV